MSSRTPGLHLARDPRRTAWLRTLLAATLAFVTFLGCTAFFYWKELEGQVSNTALDTTGLGAQSGAEQKPEPPADSFAGRAVNILISGSDSRAGQAENEMFGDPEEEDTARSDTTMLMHISADRTRVQVVSIPRDLLTTLPVCTRSDGVVVGGNWGMFNSAFTMGATSADDIAGAIACTKSAAEELTGIPIDGFIVVDFKGFIGMINALNGVWYNVEEDVNDDDARAWLTAGCQKLDGLQALGYARVRKSLGDGSDVERMGRQQQLVAAMFREVMAKNFVTDLPSLTKFVREAVASLQVSPNLSDLNTDIGLLLSIANIDRANIQFLTMPTYTSYEDANRLEAWEPYATGVWEALLADQPLPVGTEYKDGNGTDQVVPDPAAAQPAGPVASEGAIEGTDPTATEHPADPTATDPAATEPAIDPATGEAVPATPAPTPEPCPPAGVR